MIEDVTGNSQKRPRVLLVKDHAIIRKGMQKGKGLGIAGEPNDREGAVVLATRLMPDVVVMDHNLWKLIGIKAARHIHRELLP